jgi:hypothetical protein
MGKAAAIGKAAAGGTATDVAGRERPAFLGLSSPPGSNPKKLN